jgi:hypothetical protein
MAATARPRTKLVPDAPPAREPRGAAEHPVVVVVVVIAGSGAGSVALVSVHVSPSQ